MKYEYKSLDFYTNSEEETVATKIKNDLLAAMGQGWTPNYSITFKDYVTVFLRKVKIEE